MGFELTKILCRVLGDSVRIEIYDKDTFEGGTGHLRLPRAWDKTQTKVKLLRDHITFVMGDRPPKIHEKFLTPEDFSEGDWSKTIVVDCTDMGEGRSELWDALELAGARGIRGSYDGMGMRTISPGPPLSVGAPTAGYMTPPNYAQMVSAAGDLAQAILYLLYTGDLMEFQHFIPTPENRSQIIGGQEDVILHSNSGEVSHS